MPETSVTATSADTLTGGLSDLYNLINGKTTAVDATRTNTGTTSTAPVTNTSTVARSGSTDVNTTVNSGSTNTSLSDVLASITGTTTSNGTSASSSDTLNQIIGSSLNTSNGSTNQSTSGSNSSATSGSSNQATSGSSSQTTSGSTSQSQSGSTSQSSTGITSNSGSQNVTTNTTAGSDNTTHTVTANHLDQAGLNAMLTAALSGTSGLASVTKGQHEAGLYNSSTNEQLVNDLLTRTAGEIAKANSSVSTDATQHIGATTGTSTQDVGASTSTNSNTGSSTNVANIVGTNSSNTSGTNSSNTSGSNSSNTSGSTSSNTSGTNSNTTTGSTNQTQTGSTNTTGTTSNVGTNDQTSNTSTSGTQIIGGSTNTATLNTGPASTTTTTNLGGTSGTTSNTENLNSNTQSGGLTAQGIAQTTLAGLTGAALTAAMRGLTSTFPNLFSSNTNWSDYGIQGDQTAAGSGGPTGDLYNTGGMGDTSGGTVDTGGYDLSNTGGYDFSGPDGFEVNFASGGLVRPRMGYADGGLVENDFTDLVAHRNRVNADIPSDVVASTPSSATAGNTNSQKGLASLAVAISGATDNPLGVPAVVAAANTLNSTSASLASATPGSSHPAIGTDTLSRLLASGRNSSADGYQAVYSSMGGENNAESAAQLSEIVGNVTTTGGRYGVGSFDSYTPEGTYQGHRSATPDLSTQDFLTFLATAASLGASGVLGFAKGVGSRAANDAVNSYSTGGAISGPGTSTSDSIPINVSNNEFIVNAKSTQAVGADAMEEINSLRVGDPKAKQIRALLGLGA